MNKNISPTLKCQQIVKERNNKGLETYNFGLGANPIPQPSLFIEALKENAHRKEYTSCEGIPELNNTIQNLYSKNNSYKILIGNGLKELLFIIQLAFNGKIFHINPSWVSYREHIKILKKESDLIDINTKIENKYKIDLDYLENKLKENFNYSKMIIINNPNNPLGISLTNEELKNLSEIIKKYNCIVISDEIYLNLSYKQNIKSISNYIPDLTVRCSSVSKDLGCGGYRVGWMAFPKEQIDLFNKCKMFSSSIYSCAPTPIQYATNVILNNKRIFKQHCSISIEIFKFLSKKVCGILKKTELEFVDPDSCWYIFLNFYKYKEKLSNINVKNSEDLCFHLINEIGFISVPGSAFNLEGLNLRISLVDFDLKMDDYNIKEFNIRRLLKGINQLVYFLDNLI